MRINEEASEGLITGYPGGPILPKEGTCEKGGGGNTVPTMPLKL